MIQLIIILKNLSLWSIQYIIQILILISILNLNFLRLILIFGFKYGCSRLQLIQELVIINISIRLFNFTVQILNEVVHDIFFFLEETIFST